MTDLHCLVCGCSLEGGLDTYGDGLCQVCFFDQLDGLPPTKLYDPIMQRFVTYGRCPFEREEQRDTRRLLRRLLTISQFGYR